jgi:excisionase family DNA binding protein
MKEVLTAKDVAKLLRLNKITVYKYANEGKIPGVLIGNRWRFDRAQIEGLLDDPRRQVVSLAERRNLKAG